jgi:predicted Rossmann fold nucleotide-binding protein DprA/Smf involved in DNA uptake
VRAALAGGAWAEVAPWPLDDARFAGNAAWLARGDGRVTALLASAAPARRASARVDAAAGANVAARLAAALGVRARTLDDLGRRAGLAPGEAAVAALELELAGRAVRLPGDRYRRSPA